MARDVWAGCSVRLQKCTGDQDDMVQLMEELIARLCTDELEQFLVQAWFIWNQRNALLHGKKMQAPEILIKHARDFTEEFKRAKNQLSAQCSTLPTIPNPMRWKPPPLNRFKLNFDASIFQELGCTGVGAIIRNDRGEVMASLSAKGPPVACSDEAEALACRRAVEFAIECGFTDLVIEGDNQAIMSALSLRKNFSFSLGHIIQDVACMLSGLRWSQVLFARRSANIVAHALARYAKDIIDEVVWIEDFPPPAMEALYFDSNSI